MPFQPLTQPPHGLVLADKLNRFDLFHLRNFVTEFLRLRRSSGILDKDLQLAVLIQTRLKGDEFHSRRAIMAVQTLVKGADDAFPSCYPSIALSLPGIQEPAPFSVRSYPSSETSPAAGYSRWLRKGIRIIRAAANSAKPVPAVRLSTPSKMWPIYMMQIFCQPGRGDGRVSGGWRRKWRDGSFGLILKSGTYASAAVSA